MSQSLNRVCLIGRLGRDPEARSMQGGNVFVTLALATNETWTDKRTGKRNARTEWHDVVIFNDHMAEVAQKFLRKGSRVYVEGSLQTRAWEDQHGQRLCTTEIVLRQYDAKLIMLDGQEDPKEQGHSLCKEIA